MIFRARLIVRYNDIKKTAKMKRERKKPTCSRSVTIIGGSLNLEDTERSKIKVTVTYNNTKSAQTSIQYYILNHEQE